MRLTHPRARPLVPALALAFAACLARGAAADPVLHQVQYKTSGYVSLQGAAGAGPVDFAGVPDATITTPATTTTGGIPVPAFASAGGFVDSLPAGQSVTYVDTPITVEIKPEAIDGLAVSGLPVVTLKGLLNGHQDAGSSSLVATFTPPAAAEFTAGDLRGTLSFPIGAAGLPILAGGGTGVPMQIGVSGLAPPPSAEAATPEPATAAVLLAGLAGLALRQRLRRKA